MHMYIRSIIIGVFVSAFLLAGFLLLANAALVGFVAHDSTPLLGKVHFLSAIVLSDVRADLVFLSVTYVLLSVHITLLYAYLARRRAAAAPTGAGFLSIVLSMFGVGCATCGSVILGTLFGWTGVLVTLPFSNNGIRYTGLVLMALATTYLARELRRPLVC